MCVVLMVMKIEERFMSRFDSIVVTGSEVHALGKLSKDEGLQKMVGLGPGVEVGIPEITEEFHVPTALLEAYASERE
jgi:hypothetical protein